MSRSWRTPSSCAPEDTYSRESSHDQGELRPDLRHDPRRVVARVLPGRDPCGARGQRGPVAPDPRRGGPPEGPIVGSDPPVGVGETGTDPAAAALKLMARR